MENKNYSIIFRLLHWSIAICIFMILITIFLRMTWMNKYNVASIIQDYLATTNQMLTYDEIVVLAKQIRKPMWNWHIYIGYILVGLISLRFSLSAFGVVIFQNPFLKKLQAKKKFQYWIYLFFYTFITFFVFQTKNIQKLLNYIIILIVKLRRQPIKLFA